jgi:xylulokinase
LARIAATGESAETVCTKPEIVDITQPDPKLVDLFARQRERFTALYAAVKPEFRT